MRMMTLMPQPKSQTYPTPQNTLNFLFIVLLISIAYNSTTPKSRPELQGVALVFSYSGLLPQARPVLQVMALVFSDSKLCHRQT